MSKLVIVKDEYLEHGLLKNVVKKVSSKITAQNKNNTTKSEKTTNKTTNWRKMASQKTDRDDHKYLYKLTSKKGKVRYVYEQPKKKKTPKKVENQKSFSLFNRKKNMNKNKNKIDTNTTRIERKPKNKDTKYEGIGLLVAKIVMKRLVNTLVSSWFKDQNTETEIEHKPSPEVINEINSDADAVNPNVYDSFEYQINCPSCSLAYEMRRRGYNVEATNEDGASDPEIEKIFNKKLEPVDLEPYSTPDPFGTLNITLDDARKGIEDAILEQSNGEDARGVMTFYYSDSNYDGAYDGGHILNWEIVDNQVFIVDSQAPIAIYTLKPSDADNYVWNDDVWDTYMSSIALETVLIARTDDAELNPAEIAKRVRPKNEGQGYE